MIRFGPDQQNFQPVVGIAAVVAQKLRGLPIVADENVKIAVVVEVADRCAPANSRQEKIRSKLVANILENSSAGVAEHQLRLGIFCIRVIALDVIEHVPVCPEEIKAAVVIKIEEACTESPHVEDCIAELRAKQI